MKKKTSDTDQKVSNKRDDEYRIMAMFYAAENSLKGKKYKQKIRHGIDNLRGISRRIVILIPISIRKKWESSIRHTSSHQLIVEVTGAQ